MTKLRPVHRTLGIILCLFTLYIGCTGLLIQWVDLGALFRHAPATDPEMMAMRESINGTDNYSVIQPTDYAAPALPDGYDFAAGMGNVLKGARASAGANTPLSFIELRAIHGIPVGLVRAGDKTLRFDPATGAALPNPPPSARRGGQTPSQHGIFKNWHRMAILSGTAGSLLAIVNALIAIGLFVMIVTGLALYFQLLRARRRAGLTQIFWASGGWWKTLHRGVSIAAAAFLMVVSISGAMLSIDTVAMGIWRLGHPGVRFPPGITADYSSPLADSEVAGMLSTTLSAFHRAEGGTPIKVLRIRYFSGMPQGLLIAGTGDKSTHQVVFNAATGKRASMTEPGYPYTGFPLGWREHELMKQIHRGDALGIPGRLMDVFAGLSLVFLSASGLYMYVDLWRRRRRAKRT